MIYWNYHFSAQRGIAVTWHPSLLSVVVSVGILLHFNLLTSLKPLGQFEPNLVDIFFFVVDQKYTKEARGPNVPKVWKGVSIISCFTYISDFSVKYFFQPIYNKFSYFEKKNLKIFCSETLAEMFFDPRLAEILNGK